MSRYPSGLMVAVAGCVGSAAHGGAVPSLSGPSNPVAANPALDAR